MIIKRKYIKPDIEEHFVDGMISLWAGSAITPPAQASEAAPSAASAPSPEFENPSAAEYPFGGDSPDFSNM